MRSGPIADGLAHKVTGAHELSLHLREWAGPPPPVVFLHGFLLDSHAWDFVTAPLLGSRRILAFDSRGHGRSDLDPAFRYHHAALGLDAREVLDRLEAAPFDVVAHSTSGHAMIGLAARRPDLLRRLVLVEAGPELRAHGAGGARSGAEPEEPVIPSPESYARALSRRHPRADPRVLAHLARHGLRERTEGGYERRLDPAFTRPKSGADPEHRQRFDREAWARKETGRLWEFMTRIRCPTLVIYGAESPMLSRETADRMRQVLLDGRVARIEDAGHVVMLDAPDAFRSALNEFLLGDGR